MSHKASIETQWGRVEITTSNKGVTSIMLMDSGRGLGRRSLAKGGTGGLEPVPALLREVKAQVVEYLDGKRREFTVPIDMSGGTAFQRKVWRAIVRVPYGRVRSYQWVATKVGGKQYARAVGMALGSNPVPIVVPCHRIVAHDGSLGGFSCGLPMKRRLLKLEGTLGQLDA